MLGWNRGTVRKLADPNARRGVRAKSTLCEIFHENTKLTPLSGRAAGTRSAAFLRSAVMRKLVASPYKTYSLMDREELPGVTAAGQLEAAVVNRRSLRRFGGDAMKLQDLARILYLTYGLVSPGRGARPIASGGGLYPLELYVTAVNVDGLRSGVYHYNVEHHCLDVIRREVADFDELEKILWLGDLEAPEASAAIVYVTAILQRTTLKYGDRGYRLVLLEAGEAIHNIALLACQMNLACCPLGGFMDNMLSAYLEVDGVDEVPLVPLVIGARKETPSPQRGTASQ